MTEKNKVLGYWRGRKDARKTQKLCFLSKILKGECRKRRAHLQAYVANSCWLNCLYKADVLDFVHNFLPLPTPNRIWLISKHKIQQEEEKQPPNTSLLTASVIASHSGLAKWQQVSLSMARHQRGRTWPWRPRITASAGEYVMLSEEV